MHCTHHISIYTIDTSPPCQSQASQMRGTYSESKWYVTAVVIFLYLLCFACKSTHLLCTSMHFILATLEWKKAHANDYLENELEIYTQIKRICKMSDFMHREACNKAKNSCWEKYLRKSLHCFSGRNACLLKALLVTDVYLLMKRRTYCNMKRSLHTT